MTVTFRSIQVLRAIAALLVVLFHLRIVEERFGVDGALLPRFVRFADAGVDLFFVISGFVIATLVETSPASGAGASRFLIRRAWRVLPPYWIYTTLVVALMVFMPGVANSSYAGQSVLASYLLWPQPTLPVLTVGWTLVHEAYFYIVIAAVIATLGGRWLTQALLCWSVAIVLAQTSDSDIVRGPLGALVSSPMTLEFIAGGLLGVSWHRIPAAAAPTLLMAGALAFVGGMAYIDSFPPALSYLPLRVLIFGAASLLIVAGCVRLEHDGRWPACAAAEAVGNASYSLYLSHVFVISATGRLWQWTGLNASAVQHAAFIAATVGLCLAAGLVSYRFLERPFVSAPAVIWRRNALFNTRWSAAA